MKFTKVVGIVVLFHVFLLGVLMFQPGCQTMENYCGVSEPECVSCPSSECVDYSLGNGEIVAEERWVNVVEEEPVKNMRFKPMKPVREVSNQWTGGAMGVAKGGMEVVEGGEAYVVKAGDSLWVIAKRSGVSVDELASANGMSKDGVLKVGQKLVIPMKKSSVGAVQAGGEQASYTIAKGDTLSGIAARFHVSVEDIKRANNMGDSVIYAGKKIIIPGASAKDIDLALSKNSNKNVLEKRENVEVSKDGTYQVKSGDVLSSIASKFGVSVSDLMKWNNIVDARKLRAGQMLVIKDPYGASTPASMVEVEVPSYSKIEEMDILIPETVEELPDESGFELFEDDMLFDTSEEIPTVRVSEE